MLRNHKFRNLDKRLFILTSYIIFRRKDVGFDDRKNAMIEVLGLDLTSYDFFADFMTRSEILVDDG